MRSNHNSSVLLGLRLVSVVVLTVTALSSFFWTARAQDKPDAAAQEEIKRVKAEREALDKTIWADEVAAQDHEMPFVNLWDQTRESNDQIIDLGKFDFQTIAFGQPKLTRGLQWGIEVLNLKEGSKAHSAADFRKMLAGWKELGYRVVDTEWHHLVFEPAGRNGRLTARSVVTMAINVENIKMDHRLIVRGRLGVEWSDRKDAQGLPIVQSLEASQLELVQRKAPAPFKMLFEAKTAPPLERILPLLVYDLNGDGLSEVILGGLNRVFWNKGGGIFHMEMFMKHPMPMFDAAILADFNGDGHVDLVYVGEDRTAMIVFGEKGGTFPNPGRRCVSNHFEFPKAFTAGDIDGDGDLDLYIGQYKFPYAGGQMPTPFFDANDGYPGALLLNDGKGNFTDVTKEAGLEKKRTRRTYSSSFVDLDDDGDLDLLVVSDFSGVDIHYNDGKGKFTDVTDKAINERHLFGMAHTFGDYDSDGKLDFFTIGMSSTTARRLEGMGLKPQGYKEITDKRMAMAYGNRMYLRRGEGYIQAPFNDVVARTGWSWGTTTFDFDNDGDKDIYVGNGHSSGKSARDYCTRYWCHDVYNLTPAPSKALNNVFFEELKTVNTGEISWNGYEKNVLYLNMGGGDFVNVAFLMGVAFEFDTRGVASEDLDNDGLPDLLVSSYALRGLGVNRHKLHVLKNELKTGNHWIGVNLAEEGGGVSPVGAKVIIRHSGRQQVAAIVTGDSFSTQHPNRAHFGLGAATGVDELIVQWANGKVKKIANPAVDAYHNVRLRP